MATKTEIEVLIRETEEAADLYGLDGGGDALEDEEDLLTGEGFKADDDVLCLHNDDTLHTRGHAVDKFVKLDNITDWCIRHAYADHKISTIANLLTVKIAANTITGKPIEDTTKDVEDTLRGMISGIKWEWLFGDIAELLCDEVSEGYAFEMEG